VKLISVFRVVLILLGILNKIRSPKEAKHNEIAVVSENRTRDSQTKAILPIQLALMM